MRAPLRVHVLLTLFLACSTAMAQLNWAPGPSGPPGRNVAAMVIDHAGGGLLLFGGYSNGLYFNDTWSWTGTGWLQRTPAQSPPARYGAEMASDPVRRRIVLFAGGSVLAPFGDTWEWDGTTWTQMQPASSPAARAGHGMTYDPLSGRTLVFGGSSAIASLRDTWLWDGTQWAQAATVATPPWQNRPRLAFDASRQVVVMSSGLGTTWEWNGSNWFANAASSTAPGANGGAMTYDEARQRIVWYGGCDANGNELPIGVLDFDGIRWTSRATAVNPPLRYWQAMAFDPVSQQIVSFAGRIRQAYLADNWLLFPVSPATAVSFGTGCAGSGGVLHLDAETVPWLGDSLRVRWSNLPSSGALVSMAFGVSNQTFNSVSLPYSLGSYGLTGCSLLVALGAIASWTATGSTLVTQLPVPASPGLLGRDVFLQGFAFDSAANPGGMSASNGLRARFGSR